MGWDSVRRVAILWGPSGLGITTKADENFPLQLSAGHPVTLTQLNYDGHLI